MKAARHSRTPDWCRQGLTLVEMLIAMFISSIVIVALLNLMTGSQKMTDLSVSQSVRQEEVQNVGALLGDDVRASRTLYLTTPTWLSTAFPGLPISRTLHLTQTPGGTCPAVKEVAYLIVPRSSLVDSSQPWLALQNDPQNTERLVLLRATNCGGAVRTRLVADYLESAQFAISLQGTTTFTNNPLDLIATAGISYRAVQLQLAAARTSGGKVTRVPSSGTQTFVAAARVTN